MYSNMSKYQQSKEKGDSKSECRDLKRRSIHKGKDEHSETFSSSKTRGVYPKLNVEDEADSLEQIEEEWNNQMHFENQAKYKIHELYEKESCSIANTQYDSGYSRRNEKQATSKIEKEATSTNEKEAASSNCIRFIILTITIILVSIPTFRYIFFTSRQRDLVTVADKIEDLKNHFPDQNEKTYHILKISLRKVVDVKEPDAPAIITLIANKNSKSIASDFSQHLAKTFVSDAFLLINDSMYWHRNPDDIKYNIDTEIRSKLKEDSLNFVIVDNLQNIPYEAAMIFHSYCDHGSAPYKRAVFLFIVPLNETLVKDASPKYIDKVAMNRLKMIWSKATSDMIDSLITRITVNVINIR